LSSGGDDPSTDGAHPGMYAIQFCSRVAIRDELATAQMADRPGYAIRVLDGMSILAATATAREIDSPDTISGFAPITGAIAIALGALFRDRLPFRFPNFMIKAMHGLRALHSGKVGDVVWLTLGVGGLGTLLAILLN